MSTMQSEQGTGQPGGDTGVAEPPPKPKDAKSLLKMDVGSLAGRLSGVFSSKRKAVVEPEAVATGRYRLALHAWTGGWQWTIVDESGQVVDNRGGDMPEGGAGQGAVLKQAADELAGSADLLRELRDVVLVLEDPEIVHMDGKAAMVRHQGAPTLRDVGCQMLNAKKATFGRQMLPTAGEELPVYAFADAEGLSRQLGSLDWMALKVVSVVPLGSLLLQVAASRASVGAAGCALSFSETHTYLALVDTAAGMTLFRTVPVGRQALAAALAAANGISIGDARAMLASRDLLSELPVDRVKEVNDSLSFGVLERALTPLMAKLIAEVRDTLSFFAEQRMAVPASEVSVLNRGGEPVGLIELFGRFLGKAVTAMEQPPLACLTAAAPDQVANLLDGAEGTLVTVGKVAYTYDKNKLVPTRSLASRDALVKENAKRAAAAKTQAKSKGGGGRRRGQPEKTKGGQLAALVANLRERLNSPDVGGGLARLGVALPLSMEDLDEEARKDRIFHGAFAFAMAVVIYFGWSHVDDAAAVHRSALNSASVAVNKNGALRKEVGVTASQISDKVLWTEKFVALGRNMNETLWLTDVFLADSERQVGNAKVTSKKMVMEGAVLPSTDGHVLEISKFIRALLADKDNFMSDFREITFEGAHIDSAEQDHVVKFRIEAYYDANKRITTRASQGNSPVGKMQDSVRERVEQTDKALTGKTSN